MADIDGDQRVQVNVRLTGELVKLLDRKRVELQETSGVFPSRSDIVRIAIETYVAPPKKARRTSR